VSKTSPRFSSKGPARRIVLLLLILTAPANLTLAHQDRVIRLNADGRLVGLPAQYEPARLLIPTRSAGHVVLQLGQKRLELPDCLSVLFAKARRPHIQLSASWYHDPKVLPFYLHIRLPVAAPNANGYYDRWSILIDITKVAVYQVEAVFAVGESSQRAQGIEIKTFCGTGGVTETIGTVR
jgi:hypothetical protein